MGENSKIEWTHHTFNPWWGCVKVSPGCHLCYAETFSKRTGHSIWGVDAPRRFFGDKHWNEPRKWNAEAEQAGERRRVFCASMADVFENYGSTTPIGDRMEEARVDLWRLIEKTPALDWLLLTKRPQYIMHMIPYEWREKLPANVWLGTTVENQEQVDKRIPELLKVPAAVRFLSCEPLLGLVDLSIVHVPYEARGGVDWVICGGESGHGARLMQLEWARSLRDQCTIAGVPFHFKQWGEWVPRNQYTGANPVGAWKWRTIDDVGYWHVGKKAAGRMLDGREWNEYPAMHEVSE